MSVKFNEQLSWPADLQTVTIYIFPSHINLELPVALCTSKFAFLSLPSQRNFIHMSSCIYYIQLHGSASGIILQAAGSIPNEAIGLFNLPNLSSRTMA
jgi:hypothetical protein